MAVNLQLLTRGQFILGIGAGNNPAEDYAFDYALPPAGQRLDQTTNAIQDIRALWTQSPATFAGPYYTVRGA